MSWLLIVIISQFFQAIALFLDKFLLQRSMPKPLVLTFWTVMANVFAFAFVFFDFNFFPSWYVIFLSLLAGALFTVGLLFFYYGLKTGEATHITPLTGAVVPVVSFFVSYLWFNEVLSFNQTVAVIFLVFGALLISFEKSKEHSGVHIGMLWAVLAGVAFAVSYVMARAVYLEETFSTGFVWARVGAFLAAFPLLLSKEVRASFSFKKKKKNEKGNLAILLVNKGAAAFYFVGMNFAISIASATLVNALAGLQYALLFILVLAFSKFKPKTFNEQFSRMEVIQESLAILLIIVGLGFMVF